MCTVAGTLFYMAPEVRETTKSPLEVNNLKVGANLVATCQYDAEVDMWSIGCLLYQCVAGEVRCAFTHISISSFTIVLSRFHLMSVHYVESSSTRHAPITTHTTCPTCPKAPPTR